MSPGDGRPISMAPTQAVSPGMPSTDRNWLARPSAGVDAVQAFAARHHAALGPVQEAPDQVTLAWKRAWRLAMTRATTRETIGRSSSKPGA